MTSTTSNQSRDHFPSVKSRATNMRHVLTLFDLSGDELRDILALAQSVKADWAEGSRQPRLTGYVLGMVFEKPSLRTRVSFEAGMAQLGGSSIFLGPDAGWGKRESVADFGRVVSQYLDVLVFRGNDHGVLEELATHCGCPVINGLTPDSHPCQAIADIMTIRESCPAGEQSIVSYVGDGNNVARSLATACAMLGMPFRIASPHGYQFDADFLERLHREFPNALLELTTDSAQAVRGADAVYTDVWASMGQESQRQQRLSDFSAYQVDGRLLANANSNAKFLHCLPARRGEEVTEEVIDGPQSVVVAQAGNRMHAQKAILLWMLGK